MRYVFLLEVKYEDVYGDELTDILFAGTNSEKIMNVKEYLNAYLKSLDGSEIIEILEEKYMLEDTVKKDLLKRFPDCEDSDGYCSEFKSIDVRSIPLALELFDFPIIESNNKKSTKGEV